MTTLPFTTLDVFTQTPFKGNPLAVVTIPVGVNLSQDQKQAIAREFNLSETTFVHDVADPATTSERRFDIFTREAEIPFAGHPTIGTAAFLYSRGVRTLIAKAGPITIEPMANRALRAAIPYNVRLHQNRLPVPDPASFPVSQAEVAKAEGGSPLFSIVNGMAFALIELPSLEALGAVQFGAMPELPKELLDDGWNAGWVTRRYYFIRIAAENLNGRAVYKIRTRMVRRSMEDPATGSAACALASYLSLHELKDKSITFEITQGVEMGRDSDILIDTEVGSDENGIRKLEALHLGGKAVEVMSGSITARFEASQ
ncbi:phenazine biosynthesis-like protein [Colletotrichum karsti]|uniref:Phenazine biosynthesis-like protein n=1 Tax=Colletotrichum karsti TaxID=1095194 RepID=A0A9P6I5M0_9PEZI|nr:phenazine biosynthesis-like protein [Colletotrichum karsti]KAF9876679.1 phenazine biosynthesis-like protein [Colletotrichum karsti]